MKKYVMNKNVNHDGKLYDKGAELKESDKGFKEIVGAGHADEMSFEDGETEAQNQEQVDGETEAQNQEQDASESEDQPAKPAQSNKKPKK